MTEEVNRGCDKRGERPGAGRRRSRPGVAFAAAWVCALGALAPALPAAEPPAVPAPAELRAEVVVNGRTATAGQIDARDVGQAVPASFSSRVRNTPGFAWHVSRHFALKTDYPADKAHACLRLLELAWPHYVELFGAQPPGMDRRRLALVYASSEDQLRKALASDGIVWDFSGGGITFEGVYAAYAFPSGSLQYHHRYLLLHECTHLFQMCLAGQLMDTPPWLYEGLADSLASHVYDPAAQRLTLHVLDKPTTADFLDMGLRELGRQPAALRELARSASPGRGAAFLMIHFLTDDVDRLQRFRLWRDRLLALPPGQARRDAALDLLPGFYGGWDRLDADFRRYLADRRNTFHYAEWGWEQEGDTLWSYGFAPEGRLSRTDVLLPPGQQARHDPFRMDYPAQPPSPLVGSVRRGGDQPSLGLVIDFSRSPERGLAGMGLGLVDAPEPAPLGGRVFRDAQAAQPGLNLTVWRLAGLAVSPRNAAEDFLTGRQIAQGQAPDVSLDPAPPPLAGLTTHFVAQWEGFLRIDAPGEHAFRLTSDDGSWLWVAGREVVHNGGLHPAARTRTGSIRLDKGLHPIRLRYVQAGADRSLDLTMAPPGRAGFLRVLLDQERRLVVDGSDLDLPPAAFDLPQAFRSALSGSGHRCGLNVRIAPDRLHLTLRTPAKATPYEEFAASVPLAPALRDRLLRCPLTLLSRGGVHGLTPLFDDARRPCGDLSRPAPANRWANPGDRPLYALYRAHHALGPHAPPLLSELKDALLQAAPGEPAAQQAALEALRSRSAELRKAVSACPAPPDAAALALDALRQAGL